ncbi:MAG: hypothetical protein C4527_23500 [Candidatus Omnitrophota bacterium]|jgi:hypothetical protein|nr:MAG: hypothetical protein C4527_23500 [Candidatus Omnitrophota bacterium]
MPEFGKKIYHIRFAIRCMKSLFEIAKINRQSFPNMFYMPFEIGAGLQRNCYKLCFAVVFYNKFNGSQNVICQAYGMMIIGKIDGCFSIGDLDKIGIENRSQKFNGIFSKI